MSPVPAIRAEAEAGPPDLAIHAGLTRSILEGFLAEETRRTGRKGVVVGLSGGLDSAVAAALAVGALGRTNVLAVLMPHRVSHPSSLKHALDLARRLRIRHREVEISSLVDPYLEARPGADPVRRGNLMARARMSVLFDISAEREALVLGTSNKTELLLGYGTLFGDMASALNPLGDLYKTQVRQMAGALKIPLAIRRKAPSADLWEGQSDEEEIGAPYEVVDRILFLLFDERWSVEEVVKAGHRRQLVERLRRMVVRSQFKRRPPLIAKISRRTVGIDFRYPRDWDS